MVATWTARGPIAMRPAEGEVLHFSEDPTITTFIPHVPATARVNAAYVWAVDAQRSPGYWFPRQCPRVLAWATAESTSSDIVAIIGPTGVSRVHAIEYVWLERMRTVRLYAYRFAAEVFHPFTEMEPERRRGTPEPTAHVAQVSVRPLGRPKGSAIC